MQNKTILKVGKVTLPGNLVLSPMAGVTDAPFREIARQSGADYTISEMLTSQLHLWNSTKTQMRLSDSWHKEDSIKILQIAGATSSIVSDAAIKCEEIGADIVEINMGCPAKKVCNVLAGSALLKDEKLVADILVGAVKRTAIPITLKTRLGWNNELKNITTIAKIAEDSGIAAITIHGRTRNDMYNGNASYDLIAEVKSQLSIPVFANGDIDSPEKAKYVLDYTHADGLYIGRASLGMPWLFQQIKDHLANGTYKTIDILEKNRIIYEHIKYIHLHYSEPLCYRFATKHIKWYLHQHSQNIAVKDKSKEIFAQLASSTNKEEQLALVSTILC